MQEGVAASIGTVLRQEPDVEKHEALTFFFEIFLTIPLLIAPIGQPRLRSKDQQNA
jgi:hypothetical protein